MRVVLPRAAQAADSIIDRVGERRLVAAMLILGALIRLVASIHYLHLRPQPVENQMVAVALAEHRGYVDAFRPGSGPSAHTGPLSPLVVAGIYALFGPETRSAELALVFLGLLMVITTFYLANACFALLETPRLFRLAALAFICLVPFQLSLESTELFVWEVGYGTAALLGILYAALRLDRKSQVQLTALVGLGIATGILEIFSPSTGLAAAGILGVLLLRRTRWPVRVFIAGLTLLVFLAATTPWKMRNEQVLGAPIRTRSSFGLSFAIGFYDGQLTQPSARAANVERLKALHPHYANGPGYDRMRAAGGEVAYERQLVAETKRWIAAHPFGFARIAVRNLWTFYCPPAWFWDRWSDSAIRPISTARAVVISALSLGGLASIAWFLFGRRQWRYLYLAAAVALPAFPYVLTFPLLRYRYPVSSLLIFLAFSGMAALISRYSNIRNNVAAHNL